MISGDPNRPFMLMTGGFKQITILDYPYCFFVIQGFQGLTRNKKCIVKFVDY